ncbi:hypothetical protein CONLIGDRAFT_260797 [Coniochaeta ligniaria NRRL 30616]|uniref:Prp 4 CRoW domain-containing protein n=1 Tax=Coniochaeta ligniaria NRRL 30616 TaxID=1408157 RepID=A0A1J7IYG5_9PEZI|nr:hypothetical protein CONLIGDRAFT_260797 [Coniochaeta ligniaria NRRL 30616]
MLAKSVSALAVLVFAAHVSASEKMPYKPLMKMSVHQMFGLGRRQADGYQPTQSICGEGATCADACGAGYATCASSDTTIHCYNTAAKQTCCPDNSGNSCDDGYYCTADTAAQTWCCPNGMDLVACAAAYSVTGGLVSETAKPTTSSSSSSTSSVVITTSSSSASSTFVAQNTTTTATSTGTVTTCTSTLAGSATWPASNTTTTAKVPSVVASTTPSTVSISGASNLGAAGALSLLAAAAIAALL